MPKVTGWSDPNTPEFRNLQRGVCPKCKAELVPGPVGGASRNYYCSNRPACAEGYNLVVWQGTLVIGEPIGRIDDARYAMYAPEPQTRQ